MSMSGGTYHDNEITLTAAILNVVGIITDTVDGIKNVKVTVDNTSEEQSAKIVLDKEVSLVEYESIKLRVEESDMIFDWDPDDGRRLFVTTWWVNTP